MQERTFPELLNLALEEIDEPRAQEIMGQRIGVSQAVISKWALGKNMPRRGSWSAIARALGVSVEDVAAAVGRTPAPSLSLREQLRRCREQLHTCELELTQVRRELATLQGGR